jgi:multidrug resistance efflux pump
MLGAAQGSLAETSQPTTPQDELPQGKDQGRLEFEPELQLYDVKPVPGGPTEPWAIPADVNKAKANADRAQRKAQRWQQLQKSGVLSKVEAERAVLQASRAVYLFQQARVIDLRKQIEALRARVAGGGGGADLLATAEATLRTSEALAVDAEESLHRTDLQFAQNQVDRQRRLAAAGLTSKAQVQKAEATLEEAKAANPAPSTATPAATAPASTAPASTAPASAAPSR